MSKPREFWITYSPEHDYFEATTEKVEGFDYHVIEKHHADQQAKIIEELKDAFKYMRKVERQSGDVILYRNDKSLCEETLTKIEEMEKSNGN